MKLRLLPVFISCLISSASYAQSGLKWSSVGLDNGSPVTSISIASKDTAFALLDQAPSGEIRSIDGGYTWLPFTTPGGFPVVFLNPLVGYTLGDNGNFGWTSYTSDGGAHWGPEVIDSHLVAQSPAILNNDTAFMAGAGAAVIMRTTDAGSSWQKMNAPFIAGIYSIAFFDPMHGVAVGGHLSAGGCLALVTTDGGMNWTQKPNPAFQDLVGVACCGSDTAISIGDAIERSTDGGNTWTELTQAPFGNWSDISSSHNNVVVVGNTGAIIYSSDAGFTWTREASGTTQNLYSVQMFGDTEAIATGQAGTILRATGTTSSVAQSITNSEQTADVYPNPAQNEIEFNIPSSENVTCSIYSEDGLLLKCSTLMPSASSEQSYTLDISSLENGIYFYRMNGEDATRSGSFVVSR